MLISMHSAVSLTLVKRIALCKNYLSLFHYHYCTALLFRPSGKKESLEKCAQTVVVTFLQLIKYWEAFLPEAKAIA